MAENPVFQAHQQWIGLLQPDGLVVSATALTESDIPLPSDASTLANLQAEFEEVLFKTEDEFGDPTSILLPFEIVADKFLKWPAESFAWAHGKQKVPANLSVHIPAFQVTLTPTHVLYDGDNKPLILIQQVEGSPDLTSRTSRDSSDWDASYIQRMDRLLRDTQVQIGIVASDSEIRLIYAPKSENSGHIGFPISAMRGVEGRKVVAAMYMLLSYDCVLAQHTLRHHRLLALLEKSREAQNKVSAELAEQVLGSLYELIKGIQTADQDARGKLLGKHLREHPEEVYHGLLTVLMRLIFLLFAEDKGIMPAGTLWSRNYSVHGLFERLRDDAQLHGANMDKRYGAWGQLLTTFNLVYNGCAHPQMKMPARLGYLFDSDKYSFLSRDDEGRMPLVSDAIVFSVLRSLLVLGGERISYRALSVENIGVVYETMMGFSVYQANGSCVVLKGAQAPAACELDELIALDGAKRITFIEELTGWNPNAKSAAAIKSAKDKDEMLDALVDRIRHDITPRPLTKGGLTLQPGEERRKSGSHYTPPQLTRPLVAKAFEPHFKRMGDKPDPDAVLSLTICDPAMGSGAFLVEATRQLSDKLIEAWAAHPDKDPCKLSGAEERTFMAMRMVAQRCIYGVDRNPAAVDLAKLSLWLLTISKDHPFTFMDHSLRHGDALVGMSKEQIKKFHWDLSKGGSILPEMRAFDKEVEEAVAARLELQKLDADRTQELEIKLKEADSKMLKAKQAGDLLVYTFFSNDKDKTRNEARERYTDRLSEAIQLGSPECKAIEALRNASKPLVPFHWELEFPEVFKFGGFSSFVGNPPFIGGKNISGGACEYYLDYLKDRWGHVGQSDIIADFFVSAFSRLNKQGTAAFISTITITQGDTKKASLEKIISDGGVIYSAKTNMDWPGKAAVMVHLLCYSRNAPGLPLILDGRSVLSIDAQLMEGEAGGHPNPIQGQDDMYKRGFEYGGEGFVFEDNSAKSTPTSVAIELMKDARNAAFIHPLIGGSELLSDAAFEPKRWLIDYNGLSEEDSRLASPELYKILREKVFPERQAKKDPNTRTYWWLHHRSSTSLRSMMQSKKRLLVHPYTSTYLCFLFVPTSIYVAAPHFVFDFDDFATFAVLQSIVHESWVRRFGGKRKSDLSYTATDCFANFPFPSDWKSNVKLREAGQKYYELRNEIAKNSNIGFTELYHEFYNHESTLPRIIKLRDAHVLMSVEVMRAYGLNVFAEELMNDSLAKLVDSKFQARVVKALLPIHEQRVSDSKIIAATNASDLSKNQKKPKKSQEPDLFNL